MRPQDAQAKIVELAPALDAALMASKLREYSKGGLPAGGSDGRGSAEKPLPLFGNTDRAILTARREYEQNLLHAALALDSAVRSQNAWCIPRTDETEKAKVLKADPLKGSGPCANVWCDVSCSGLGNDRLRHGRCRSCYRVFKLEGRDRDPRKEVAS